MNCELGHKGDCCCNCTRQIPLFKHPMNNGEGKGSITEGMGFACTAFYDMDKKDGMIFFDKPHGMCEMHNRKEKQHIIDIMKADEDDGLYNQSFQKSDKEIENWHIIESLKEGRTYL